MTFLSLATFRTSTFLIKCASTKGPFFVDRAINLPYLLRPSADDECIGPLVVARLVAACRLAPWGHRMTAARGLALTTAVRMVDRVHRNTTVCRTNTLPAITSGLADPYILVVRVAYLADRRHALYQ